MIMLQSLGWGEDDRGLSGWSDGMTRVVTEGHRETQERVAVW